MPRTRPLFFALAFALLPACDTDEPEIVGDPDYVRDPALDIPLVSARGGARSHEVGSNCMACHQAHGPGPGLFTAAGTLIGPDGAAYPDGAIELRSGAAGSGDLVLRIEADSNGNFYTTEPLPLPDVSLFPTVYNRDDKLANFMPFPTASAACNVCHVGSAVIRVLVDG